MMTVTIVAMEVLHAPYTCDQHSALLACSPCSGFASTPVDDATAPTPIRISSGVTSRSSSTPPSWTFRRAIPLTLFPADAQVSLFLTV